MTLQKYGNTGFEAGVLFYGINLSFGFLSAAWTPLANTTLSDNADTSIRATTSVAGPTGFNKNPLVESGETYRVTFQAKSSVNQTGAFTSIGDTSDTGTNPINPNLTTTYQDYSFYVALASVAFRIYATLDNNNDYFDVKNIRIIKMT